MGYCEYKIPFFIEGKYATTREMEIGGKHHEETERIERLTSVTVPLTQEKLEDKKANLSFVREDVRTLFKQELDCAEGKAILSLHGRADKVIRKQGTLIISDDKHTGYPQRHDRMTEPYNDQLLQVLTYLHSRFYLGRSFGGWGEIPHSLKMYQVNIVNTRNKSVYKTYEDIVTERHEELLFDYTSRFTQKCLKWKTFVHHNKSAKCKACGFFNECANAIH
jgi:hypothetical protein